MPHGIRGFFYAKTTRPGKSAPHRANFPGITTHSFVFLNFIGERPEKYRTPSDARNNRQVLHALSVFRKISENAPLHLSTAV
jgi:hypothetical protein